MRGHLYAAEKKALAYGSLIMTLDWDDGLVNETNPNWSVMKFH
jgi:hypothetical protein